MKDLFPNVNPQKFINKKTGEISELKYLSGEPRNYRLDLSKAVLNLNGKTEVTKQNEKFKVIPLAIRTFEAALFNTSKRMWCEMFFLNEKGQVSNFMFHRYSLDNFREQFKELYYEETNPCDAIWEIGFDSKVTSEGQKYNLATFEFELLKKKQVEEMEILRNEIKQKSTFIFQSRTQEFFSTFTAHSSSPNEPTDEDLKLEAKKHQKILDEVFPLPDAKTENQKAA